MKVKVKDKVQVLTGRHQDKLKEGVIKEVDKKNNRVKVEGIRMLHKHTKQSAKSKGGIIKTEGFIDASNVMLICPNCGKKTRVEMGFIEADGKTKKVRVCKKCNEQIDNV